MFYYIKDANGDIALANEDKDILLSSLKFYPQFSNYDVLKTDKKIIKTDEKFYFENDEELIKIRQKKFENTFLVTSKGNYRLQPKGYSNAQQSIDTINGMVNAFGELNKQIAEMVIFYPTPNFAKEDECTEQWLVEHQYNIELMNKTEWTQFYIEFSNLYAKKQYKQKGD